MNKSEQEEVLGAVETLLDHGVPLSDITWWLYEADSKLQPWWGDSFGGGQLVADVAADLCVVFRDEIDGG